MVNIHALIAEILGVDATTAEDGTGWLTFLRWLTTRGHSGVRLMPTPGCWRRSTPRGPARQDSGAVRITPPIDGRHPEELMALDAYAVAPGERPPDADSVVARYDRIVDALSESYPKSLSTTTRPTPTCWHSPCFPHRSGRTTLRND